MQRYEVFFSKSAERQIEALEHYIVASASPTVASRYIDALVEHCASLSHFPHRGNRREDQARASHHSFQKTGAIAFNAKDALVNILGIFYGGQDYESLLKEDY